MGNRPKELLRVPCAGASVVPSAIRGLVPLFLLHVAALCQRRTASGTCSLRWEMPAEIFCWTSACAAGNPAWCSSLLRPAAVQCLYSRDPFSKLLASLQADKRSCNIGSKDFNTRSQGLQCPGAPAKQLNQPVLSASTHGASTYTPTGCLANGVMLLEKLSFWTFHLLSPLYVKALLAIMWHPEDSNKISKV